MQQGTLKNFLKTRWVSILALMGLLAFYFIKKNIPDFFILGGLLTFSIVEDYRKHKKRCLYLADLQAKGLTEDAAEQNSFIEKWKATRGKGFVIFLIYNGTLLTVLFTYIFGFLIFLLKSYANFLAPGPIDLEQWFIVSFVPGIALGMIASRFLWSVNQKRFTHLTERLH